MHPEFFLPLLDWIQQHPHLSYLLVFLTAALESLAIVGLFLPGTLLMFAIGALIAADALAFWPSFWWAVAGAIAGDAFSFWIGRHFHQRLRVVWPFRRYPRLLNRGVDFFHRHGGKSVALARFVGPVRPILPAVAGMLEMPVRRFLLVDVLSALLWAPAYLLPGIVFGTSLGLASEVAGRLAALLLLLLVVLWLGIWAVQRVRRLLYPRATALINRILAWSRRHPVIRPLAGSLLDPDYPEARGVATLIGLSAVGLLLFALAAGNAAGQAPLTGLDELVYQELQALRTPWMDRVMVFVTEFGDGPVLAFVAAAILVWLAWRRHWRAAGHLLTAYAAAGLLTAVIKMLMRIPRPRDLGYQAWDAYSFPSSHATVSLTLFGFAAVLAAHDLRPRHRWLPYTLVALLVIPIGFSRLYLGAHWLSDVLGGLALGLFWVTLLGVAYIRHPAEPLSAPALGGVLAMALVVAGAWRLDTRFESDMARYALAERVTLSTTAEWLDTGWLQLPALREDLQHSRRFPFNIQYAGDPETLGRFLAEHGWREPPELSFAGALRWLTPAPDPETLPVLPQVHDGRHEALLMVSYDPPVHPYALRLWSAGLRLTDTDQPVWLGSVNRLRLHSYLGLLTFLETEPGSTALPGTLVEDLETAFSVGQRERTTDDMRRVRVILVQEE